MSSTKIYIDPTSRILYSSFYIQGLYEVFGKKNVFFKRAYFKNLVRTKEKYSFNHFFAFAVVEKDSVKRYVIDFCDPTDISQEAYDWCDIYAKINFKHCQDVDEKKIVVIPPSFGIRIWNLPETLYYCVRNLVCNLSSIPVDLKAFCRDYYHHYKREPMGSYFQREPEKEDFIFMIGTLWQPNDNAKSTNIIRAQFINSCLKIKNIRFEGGLYATPEHPGFKEFKSILFSTRYSLKEYIKNTKSSTVVFNTPAVHDCHGWKLAEFLALGKAIISTPLSNELPKALVHGEDIHIVSAAEDMPSAISFLMDNKEYRNKLSKNAADYFLQHCTPAQVIRSIMGK